VRAATDLFLAKGYAASSVREIVEAVGVTKPTLYYHFESKEGLYLTLMRRIAEEFGGLVQGLREVEGSPWSRVKALCLGVFGFCEERRPLVRLAYSIYYGPPQGAPEFDFDVYYFSLASAVEELVAEAVAAGEMRDVPVRETAFAVFSILDTAMELALNHPDRNPTAKGLERLLDILYRGLRPDEGAHP